MQFVLCVESKILHFLVESTDRQKTQFVTVEGKYQIVVVGLRGLQMRVACPDVRLSVVHRIVRRKLMIVRPGKRLGVRIPCVDPIENIDLRLHLGENEMILRINGGVKDSLSRWITTVREIVSLIDAFDFFIPDPAHHHDTRAKVNLRHQVCRVVFLDVLVVVRQHLICTLKPSTRVYRG